MVADRTQRWARISAAFDELVELPPRERAQRLAELTDSAPELVDELHALLAADVGTRGVLDCSLDAVVPELELTADDALHTWETPAGSLLGHYRLLEPIGQGGMGEVWLAERADGEYQQRVALKLLKRGMDTQAILRRFVQERSILARLRHRHIVRLLDGGMSADGRPWYAMEHIDGAPLREWASQAGLDVRARVELVACVADAVAYAHAQLVVHRDLKPGNVLVDADGEPHLLDFGIAKLLEQTDDLNLTGTGMRVLSPAYAAPEQILGQPISTATDVYALGTILYELLTGSLPHQRASRDPLALASELSLHTGIEKPSQAVQRSAPDTLARVYGGRRDGRRIARELGGDIDRILAMALRQEPERRYATAVAFAADLRAWLAGRPIAARPDSAGYRMRTFVRRHAFAVAAGLLVFVSLLAGLGVALWQAGVARAQAERAELVKDFMLSLYKESDPVARAQAQARSPRELVADGVARARVQLQRDPSLRLDVLADLGALAAAVGDVQLSAQVLDEVFTARSASEHAMSPTSAEIAAQLAGVRSMLGDNERARELAEAAVRTLRAHRGTAALSTAEAESHLARVLLLTGELDSALELSRSVHARYAAALGADDPETLARQFAVGVVLEQLTRLDEADHEFAEVAATIEQRFGPDHARMVRPLAMRADVARRQERHAEARALFARAVDIARSQLGSGHPVLGAQLMRYGDLLRRIGELDGATRALDEAEGCFAPTSSEAAQIWLFRGQLLRTQNRLEPAADAFARAHTAFLAALGPDSSFPWAASMLGAGVLLDLGRLSEAEPILERVLERQQAIEGPDSYDVAVGAGTLGRLRRLQGRHTDAVALQQRSVAILATLYGADNANTATARHELVLALLGAGESASAAAELDLLLQNLQAGTTIAAKEGDLRLQRARLARTLGDPARQTKEAAQALVLLRTATPVDDDGVAEAALLAGVALE